MTPPAETQARRRLTLAGLAAAAVCSLGLPVHAHAAAKWTAQGAGFGHGIGMSQYGAFGFAKQGKDYREILKHYYTGVEIGKTGSQTVRVLLKTAKSVSFTDAVSACNQQLDPGKTYTASKRGSQVALKEQNSQSLGTCDAPLRAEGKEAVTIGGLGPYRGALELRPTSRGLNVINAVDLESYVKGVVPNESPSSWPAEALKAQAVAARTYALTTDAKGNGFNQYADVRSQVYRGKRSEKPSTNQVTDQTAGEIVTYNGKAVTTFFFSTSGGHTENVENVFLGGTPKPWLKGVEDPYDSESPYHRWKASFSAAAIQASLGVKGTLKKVDITKRGVSPRIVSANLVGSKGTTIITGPNLKARLGLRDTWASFKRVTSSAGRASRYARSASERGTITGTVGPPSVTGKVEVQLRRGARWRTVTTAGVDLHGRYEVSVPRGTYRVVDGWAKGPAVRVR